MYLKSSEWHSLSKASEILGHGTSYVSLWLRRHEKDMPEGMVIASGKSKLISDQGIEWIKKNTKKEGDRLRTAILKVVYKTNYHFVFIPFNLNIF